MIQKSNIFSEEGTTSSERFLHTPSVFARQNLLYVQEVGRLQSLKPHRCIRENVESYLFMIVLEGNGKLTLQDKDWELTVGDCAWIDCRQHYEHISDADNGWKLAWVHFNGSIANGYYELFVKNNKSNIFHTDNRNKWNDLIGKLMEAQRDKTVLGELTSGELLIHLANMAIADVVDRDVLKREEERQEANRIREYLNEAYASSDVIEGAEAALGCEKEEIKQRFQRFYGITIEEYISSRRFNAAKELLRFSVRPIEEIVVESGIGDMITMQQLFRANEGMTAEEYRSKWAQWIRA